MNDVGTPERKSKTVGLTVYSKDSNKRYRFENYGDYCLFSRPEPTVKPSYGDRPGGHRGCSPPTPGSSRSTSSIAVAAASPRPGITWL